MLGMFTWFARRWLVREENDKENTMEQLQNMNFFVSLVLIFTSAAFTDNILLAVSGNVLVSGNLQKGRYQYRFRRRSDVCDCKYNCA